MQALKFRVNIGDASRIVIDLPAGHEGDDAEVIVLIAEPRTRSVERDEALRRQLEALRGSAGGLSKDELDARIEAERDAWE